MTGGVETRTVPVGGGRELCVEMAGEPDGKPVLVHPGEPMSRHLFGGWIADAQNKGIWGISGGGPYALACAALLPDVAVAAAAVASPGPYGVEGFDYFAGMGEGNAEGLEL